jgi:hypothetical protein
MPPCESTLGYIGLAHSDSDEEHSSQSQLRGDVSCIIDLTGSDLEGRRGGERAFSSPLYFCVLVNNTSDNLIWSIEAVSAGTLQAGLLGRIFLDFAE